MKTTSVKNEQCLGQSMQQLQSETIDLLRFPLAIMVVFIHTPHLDVVNPLDADFSLISGRGIYNLTVIILSNVLSHIAVPTFFLISGFLFFVNFQNWSWSGYKKKLHSRVKSLLIPYILWNATPFIMMLLIILLGVILHGNPIENVQNFIAKYSWHIFYDCCEWGTTRVNWLGGNLRMTGPFVLPLWFLRDLIVVTVLTPVIYCAVRKLKLYIVAILFLSYISSIWTLLPGFSITAIFFFTLGAYMALNGINIIQFASKNRMLFVPAGLVLLIITTIYNGVNTPTGQFFYPLYVFAGVFTAFYIASICIKRYGMHSNKLLVSSCFFIYAFHCACVLYSPIGLVCLTLRKVIPGDGYIEEGIRYLATPFLTAFFCIIVLVVARRIFPKLTMLFSGNK